ncbi:hypothetical protein D3C87_860000 [compost metagenome]
MNLNDIPGTDTDDDDDWLGPDPAQCDGQRWSPNKNDHGERTNEKLLAQPFYHRGRDGKMKRF